MNIFVVTVTYGDRFNLLKQVIDKSLEEGMKKVIVVDNNSSPQSRTQLKAYEKELGADKLFVLYLDDNYGSSGGFKRGLELAYSDTQCDYVLALDDDNVVSQGIYTKLSNLLAYLSLEESEVMIGMSRSLRSSDKAVIEQGSIKHYPLNSFNGFDLLSVLKNKICKSKKVVHGYYPIVPAMITAMGGLFFHKSILDTIGYPNESFYLYADDHDFTYRFTQSGGKLFISTVLYVEDIDFTNLSSEGENIGYFDEKFSEFKMYYGVRNHTFLSRKFIKSKVAFYINMFVMLVYQFRYIFMRPYPLFKKRYALYLKAIRNGLKGQLGRTY